jgi:hypothetical protein
LVYKILEKKIKYNENIKKNFDEIKNELLNLKNELKKNKINNDENRNLSLVIKKFEKKSNLNLKNIYDKIFNKKNIESIKSNDLKNIDKLILIDNKDNIFLDDIDNFFKYNFKTNKNKKYKIRCTLDCSYVKNIKLIITNNVKRFVYNYENMKFKYIDEDENIDENENINEEENIEKEIIEESKYVNYNEKINKFEFILDNNEFDENEINIYLIFVPLVIDKKINIYNYNIEVYEKSINRNIDAMIIFNINDYIQPLYIDKINILDYSEYINESSVFFI